MQALIVHDVAVYGDSKWSVHFSSMAAIKIGGDSSVLPDSKGVARTGQMKSRMTRI